MPWTAEDESILRHTYGKVFAGVIARRLNKSVGCVRVKAHRLGLSAREPAVYQKIPDGFRGISTMGNRYRVRCKGEYIGMFATLEAAAAAYNEAAGAVVNVIPPAPDDEGRRLSGPEGEVGDDGDSRHEQG